MTRQESAQQILPDTKKLFWQKVKIHDLLDCWEWTAGKTSHGYGSIRYNGYSQFAHRVSWIITYGSIPNGKLVLHHCDNPPCVNPVHLFIGTYKDNTDDMIRKGRGGLGSVGNQSGEDNYNCRITELDAINIIRLRKEGVKAIRLSELYGVSKVHVCRIASGQRWPHLAR